MSIKIDRKEFLRRLNAIGPAARVEIKKALGKSADEMASTARSFAPVDSGDLRRSISYTFGNYKPANANVRGISSGGDVSKDPDLSVTVHAGDAKAYYAGFVEFGVQDAPAQPYFFPAYRLTEKRVKRRINRAVNAAARKAAAS